MKKNLLLITIILFFAAKAYSQNKFPASGAVGIGTTSPNGKSILEIKSTTKGVLFPRMTKTQRDAIASPPDGLIIYQTDNSPGIYYHQGSWKAANNVRGLNNNLFIGQNAGSATTTATGNIALGKSALRNNTDRSGLIAIGDSALYNNGLNTFSPNDGTANVAIGHASLFSCTYGENNTAIGYQTIRGSTFASGNTAVGCKALMNATSGGSNVAIGAFALQNNAAAYQNTAVGNASMFYNNNGIKNAAYGVYSLYTNSSGSSNTAIGTEAMYYNNDGGYNTALGFGALYFTTASYYNTALGMVAGGNYNHGYNNVFVGAYADGGSAGLYNVIAIGQGAYVNSSSYARFGNSSTTSYGGYANWTNISDGRYKSNVQENVPGLAFINKLKPVTYHLEAGKLDAFQHKNAPLKMNEEGLAIYNKALKEKEQIVYTGFIAQEVEAAARELNFDFSGVDKPKNTNEDTYGLRYAEFTVPLVKAVQELSKANSEFKIRNEKLEAEVAAIKELLSTEQKQKLSSSIVSSQNKLEQNNPNPFNKSTVIRYHLLSDASAKIIIRDLNGNLVKQVSITQSGKGQVTINANELVQGTYTYTLEVNGESLDTKLMVVTK